VNVHLGVTPFAVIDIVNPRRDPGPTFAHGLTSEDLDPAPTFMAIAEEVTRRLDGAIVVAHNVNFDFNFLRYEYGRLGQFVPAWPCLCTVRAANVLGRVQGSRKLVDLCAREWVVCAGDHSALGDAEATARLLAVYLRYAAAAGFDFSHLGVRPLELPSLPEQVPPRVPDPSLSESLRPGHAAEPHPRATIAVPRRARGAHRHEG